MISLLKSRSGVHHITYMYIQASSLENLIIDLVQVSGKIYRTNRVISIQTLTAST